jgi:hypothetical protein
MASAAAHHLDKTAMSFQGNAAKRRDHPCFGSLFHDRGRIDNRPAVVHLHDE